MMKKLFAMAFAACTLAACSDTTTEETTTADTMMTTEAEPMATTVTRTPTEGDVTYTGGTVRVYRNNTWEDANDDVKLSNGVVVYRDGRAMRDGNVVMWEDGYIVDHDGNVWDRTGNAMENAWDATKHGVKEAGKAVGHAAEKVGEKAKDAVD